MRKQAESLWKTTILSSEMLKFTPKSMLSPIWIKSNIWNNIWELIIKLRMNSNNNWDKAKKNRNRLRINPLDPLKVVSALISISEDPWETSNPKKYWVKSQIPSFQVEVIPLMEKWVIQLCQWLARNNRLMVCLKWCQEAACNPQVEESLDNRRNLLLVPLQTQRRSGWEGYE